MCSCVRVRHMTIRMIIIHLWSKADCQFHIIAPLAPQILFDEFIDWALSRDLDIDDDKEAEED